MNRTIPLKNATFPKDTTEISKALIPLEDQIGLHQIRIYPNPTIGQVRVDIANLGETVANLQIYSLRGSLLQQVRLYGESANIDLGSQPHGIYLLKISIGKNTSVWKIIKD